MHFRKNGIGIPLKAASDNYDRLQLVMDFYRPQKVLFLGDLFHSDYNSDWSNFQQFLERYGSTQFDLVIGNHDILPRELFEVSLHQCVDHLVIDPFVFTHEPQDCLRGYNLAGHLHPSIKVKTRRLPSVKLPCYYFGAKSGILPAFGVFTGYGVLEEDQAQDIFLIAEGEVIPYK